jgi:nitroimidazol reductase NimA-like FMN-containing flavoprotein (pyridoxamine 5'-phosphate oxidase superfamily)
MTDDDLAGQARQIIDANRYLTLATADESGRPWASPVWFAHDAYAEYLWVSRPEARHSRNVAGRPEIGFVVFDSTVPANQGRAVYVEATAGMVPDDEVKSAVATFSRHSQQHGAGLWGPVDVTGSAHLRLYRARAGAHYILGGDDRRTEVRPA